MEGELILMPVFLSGGSGFEAGAGLGVAAFWTSGALLVWFSGDLLASALVFELWGTDAVGEPEPDGYGTSNVIAYYLFGSNPLSIFKDSTAVHGGKYSMKIVTGAYSSSGSFVGSMASYLPNGTLDFAFTGTLKEAAPYFIPGYPEANRYTQFTFYAEYAPQTGDEAVCAVALTNFSGGVRDTIAEGSVTISGTVSSFTQYTVNLTYKSTCQFPDTAIIVFTSSGTKTQAKAGSTLIVDDAAFSGDNSCTGIISETQLSAAVLAFPNPASDNITLKSTGAANNFSYVEIYDLTGRKVDAQLVQNNRVTFNTSSYSIGMYVYSAYNENHELVGVGKFNIVK